MTPRGRVMAPRGRVMTLRRRVIGRRRRRPTPRKNRPRPPAVPRGLARGGRKDGPPPSRAPASGLCPGRRGPPALRGRLPPPPARRHGAALVLVLVLVPRLRARARARARSIRARARRTRTGAAVVEMGAALQCRCTAGLLLTLGTRRVAYGVEVSTPVGIAASTAWARSSPSGRSIVTAGRPGGGAARAAAALGEAQRSFVRAKCDAWRA